MSYKEIRNIVMVSKYGGGGAEVGIKCLLTHMRCVRRDGLSKFKGRHDEVLGKVCNSAGLIRIRRGCNVDAERDGWNKYTREYQ